MSTSVSRWLKRLTSDDAELEADKLSSEVSATAGARHVGKLRSGRAGVHHGPAAVRGPAADRLAGHPGGRALRRHRRRPAGLAGSALDPRRRTRPHARRPGAGSPSGTARRSCTTPTTNCCRSTRDGSALPRPRVGAARDRRRVGSGRARRRCRSTGHPHHVGADGRPDGVVRLGAAGRRLRHRQRECGSLGWAIGAALAAGVVIAILRLVRHRPVTQAIAGLFGVGIAAFIAYRTGSAKGYFLLGIWSYVVYGGALLVSILVRWPLVGVLWESLNGRGTTWRAEPLPGPPLRPRDRRLGVGVRRHGSRCRTSSTTTTRSAGWPPPGC